jgi:hypothetical protein
MDLDNLVSAAIFIIVFFIFFFIGKLINDLLHREYKLNFELVISAGPLPGPALGWLKTCTTLLSMEF